MRGSISGGLILVGVFVLAACSTSTTPSSDSQASATSPSVAESTAASSSSTTMPIASTTTKPAAPSCDSGSTVEGEGAGAPRVDGCGVDQVWVPAGTFTQGTISIDGLQPPAWAERELGSEQPAHRVTISSGFWIDLYEVTNAAFDEFVVAGGYADPQNWSTDGWTWRGGSDVAGPADCGGGPQGPRVCISWYEAEAYAHWRGGRLPTESEWEFAARGPESSVYPWGDAWDPAKANVTEVDYLTDVGSYSNGASWVGALDMAGNAMEWVSDWMSYTYYTDEPEIDPQGPDNGTRKIEKGGWWGSNQFVARSAYRHFEDPPSYQDHHIGFRVLTLIG